MTNQGKAVSNPKRVEAGRKNRMKRGPLSLESRNRIRVAINKNKPWQRSTGPQTPAGKAKVARNGKTRQIGPRSIREIRADLCEIMCLIEVIRKSRRAVLNAI